MATISQTTLYSGTEPFGGGSSFGNSIAITGTLTTNASGIASNGDKTTAIAVGDVIRLGKISNAVTLSPSMTISVSNAFLAAAAAATPTASFGFAYMDGVDDPDNPQSATYFASAIAINTVGIYRSNTPSRPVKLKKPAYLTMTWGTADAAEAGVLDVVAYGYPT